MVNTSFEEPEPELPVCYRPKYFRVNKKKSAQKFLIPGFSSWRKGKRINNGEY